MADWFIILERSLFLRTSPKAPPNEVKISIGPLIFREFCIHFFLLFWLLLGNKKQIIVPMEIAINGFPNIFKIWKIEFELSLSSIIFNKVLEPIRRVGVKITKMGSIRFLLFVFSILLKFIWMFLLNFFA